MSQWSGFIPDILCVCLYLWGLLDSGLDPSLRPQLMFQAIFSQNLGVPHPRSGEPSCCLLFDPGGCQSYNMMWFFDPEQSECSRFWYGGCGGNGNRFTTQDECESLCLSKSR
uniref:BPTI/Kunitz inhibitor domain-containing protein n=1 Tax=Cynoglossus semilaevis TaxID=244447 RepID=A0A3P8ULY4_CYNSE